MTRLKMFLILIFLIGVIEHGIPISFLVSRRRTAFFTSSGGGSQLRVNDCIQAVRS